MKICKSSILFIGITVLLLLAITVSADTTVIDETGDVYYWNSSEIEWDWKYNIKDKSNIDITEISYTVNEAELTLKLKVNGVIQNSENIMYWAYLNTIDTNYRILWRNGEGDGFAMRIDSESGSFDFEPIVIISNDTLSATFDMLGNTANVAMCGWVHEYTGTSDTSSEWWGDWVPESYSPEHTKDVIDSNGNKGGTPGFETVVYIISFLAIALIILAKVGRK